MNTKPSDSYLRDAFRKLRRHKLAMVSLVILLVEILLLIVLPLVIKIDPNQTVGKFYEAPSAAHLLGTDGVGRDVLARILSGGKVSLVIGFLSSVLSALIGVPLGLLAGYYRGAYEMIIMRLTEVFQTLPTMVLALVVVSITGPSVTVLILVIGVLGWSRFTRLVYSSVLSVREKEYVESARAVGEKDFRIIFRYILPNVITPIMIAFTFGIASSILSESSLSFLGLGVQQPQASWGSILNAARNITVLSRYVWCWLPAGLVLVVTISAINFLGDGIRDALDTNTSIF